MCSNPYDYFPQYCPIETHRSAVYRVTCVRTLLPYSLQSLQLETHFAFFVGSSQFELIRASSKADSSQLDISTKGQAHIVYFKNQKNTLIPVSWGYFRQRRIRIWGRLMPEPLVLFAKSKSRISTKIRIRGLVTHKNPQ